MLSLPFQEKVETAGEEPRRPKIVLSIYVGNGSWLCIFWINCRRGRLEKGSIFHQLDHHFPLSKKTSLPYSETSVRLPRFLQQPLQNTEMTAFELAMSLKRSSWLSVEAFWADAASPIPSKAITHSRPIHGCWFLSSMIFSPNRVV